MIFKAITTTLLAAFVLSGCQLLKAPEKPRETYEFSAPSFDGGVAGGTNAQLLVKLPTSLKAIDSERMILRPTPKIITYVAGAQWSDSVPRLVQAKLVEAFENTGSAGATAKPGDGLVIDFQLIPDIRRFEIIGGEAVIEVSIKLLSDKSGRVVASRIFTTSAATGGNQPENYVAAFDRAFSSFAEDVIAWTFRQV
ncbi:ABC-type transport auxiliary lipoprotein family protein [Ahrensia sp. R2A130]|uniref:ABC-type transport auxiliary lipoprotein family protein n=1 Tax=Ahrensia sp. R2A130 TaxID=744979 RepID=UPI0001E0E862|nr:ABC-type transport auxiliary lipoprotein family protein [Ahrensia sp. R2A130]EFL90392.1 lipoprotein [Ahrensia sp. R2A130]